MPHIRIKEKLRPIKSEPLSEELVQEMIFSTLSAEQQKHFEKIHEIDYAIQLAEKGRFRVNAYKAQGKYEAVIRLLSTEVQGATALNLPPIINQIAKMKEGLVLVAGATGSGKSTTLAAMIDAINETESKRIITIENPVEIVHRNKKAMISQREVGIDTNSFSNALRSVLRQDPDVILIGEIRDKDTAEAAIQAAQTGHLVFSTIHAGSAEEAVFRFLNIFAPEDRDNMRETLSVVLNGILSQKLIIDKFRNRRPILEILIKSDRVAKLIRDPQHAEKYKTVISEGGIHGMQTMEQDLVKLVQNNLVDPETAVAAAPNGREVRQELRRLNIPTK